jgi:hypothetical protein
LPKAKLKITFDGFRFAVLHVRQVQHRCLGIEVRKWARQKRDLAALPSDSTIH